MKFGLKTFSHSTLCRVFKNMEGFIDAVEKAGRSGKAINTGTETETKARKEKIQPCKKRQFPSLQDTVERRVKMAHFLSGFNKDIVKNNICSAARNLVKHWQYKTTRLLL